MAFGNQQTDNPMLAEERRHESWSSLGPPRQDYLKLITNTDLTLLAKKHNHFANFFSCPETTVPLVKVGAVSKSPRPRAKP